MTGPGLRRQSPHVSKPDAGSNIQVTNSVMHHDDTAGMALHIVRCKCASMRSMFACAQTRLPPCPSIITLCQHADLQTLKHICLMQSGHASSCCVHVSSHATTASYLCESQHIIKVAPGTGGCVWKSYVCRLCGNGIQTCRNSDSNFRSSVFFCSNLASTCCTASAMGASDWSAVDSVCTACIVYRTLLNLQCCTSFDW